MTDQDPERPAEGSPPSIDDIGHRLQAIRREQPKPRTDASGRSVDGAGLGIGLRISVELVAAIAVGGGLGAALGVATGLLPVFLVLGLMLGMAAGVMNVYRVAKGLDDTVGIGLAERRARQGRQSGSAPSDTPQSGPGDGPTG